MNEREDFSAEYEVQSSMVGRPESPLLEKCTRQEIESGIRDLITKKLLYQNVTVSIERVLPQKLEESRAKLTPQRLAELTKEIRFRPWRMRTNHLGDDAGTMGISKSARAGTDAIGTSPDRMSLYFIVPAVQLYCPDCNGITTFSALCSSTEGGFGAPPPRRTETGTHQNYVFFYRCEGCRGFIQTVLIRREALKLQLCGFAPRKVQPADSRVPKLLNPVYLDAVNSVSEGDIFAGFYHLRTFVEHYAKHHLNVPLATQIRGDELIRKYNEVLPLAVKETLPSLAVAYEDLSQKLHARSGKIEEFHAHLEKILDHIVGVKLLTKYQPAGGS